MAQPDPGPAALGAFSRGRLLPSTLAPLHGERTEELSAGPGWRIEQILSGELDQPVEDRLDHVEWVLLVDGSAEMEVGDRAVHLRAGDWLRIGRDLPHRVLATEPGTRWLAVHLELPATP